MGQANKQVLSLAPVINSPEGGPAVKVKALVPEAPVAIMSRQHKGMLYIFAVAMRNSDATATFELPAPAAGQVEVIDESRTIPVKDSQFRDTFKPSQVHLYRLAPPKGS